MKNLIICGTAKPLYYHKNNCVIMKVFYNVWLLGQTDKIPEINFFGVIDTELFGYSDLQELAREKFCKYFNCDDFNIISIENITVLESETKL